MQPAVTVFSFLRGYTHKFQFNKMMKLVLLIVALFAVFVNSVPAPTYPEEDESSLYYRPYNIAPFYMPEPICSFKCGIKCYKMGFYDGGCQNSMCTCVGGGYGFPGNFGLRYL